MRVSVCIVGFRNAEDVARCLASLEASTHTNFEVVICENGGAASVRELRQGLPPQLTGGQSVRILDAGGNVGYAAGVNKAMAASLSAEAWWILNPDTRPDAVALAALIRKLQAADCDAVGGVLVQDDGLVQSAGGHWQAALGRAVSLGRGRRADQIDAPQIEQEMDFISGASALVSRRFVEKFGFMRQDYFLYCEEVEWFLRGKASGALYGLAPDALVTHDAGSTTGSGHAAKHLPRLPVYLNERNRILLTRDILGGWLPVVAFGSLAVIGARYVRRGAWSQLGYALQGWVAGIMNRRGPPKWVEAPMLPSHFDPRTPA